MLAFTNGGDGVASPVQTATTEQDIPGAPESVKALAMTENSILVRNTLVETFVIFAYHVTSPVQSGRGLLKTFFPLVIDLLNNRKFNNFLFLIILPKFIICCKYVIKNILPIFLTG